MYQQTEGLHSRDRKTEGHHGWDCREEGRHGVRHRSEGHLVWGNRPEGGYNGGQRGGHRDRFASGGAPVSIYKTPGTYEVLVFAPGRVKENFEVRISRTDLLIRYRPTEDTSSLDWVRKEYSRGGFERSFLVDESIETDNIQAKYEDGVLKLSLTIKPGSEAPAQQVKVS